MCRRYEVIKVSETGGKLLKNRMIETIDRHESCEIFWKKGNLTSDFIKKLPNENAQKLMIEVCFLIYKEKGKEIQTCNYNVDANRKRYQQEKQHIIELIKILSPSLFLSVVLEKLSQGASALDFLKNYMKQNNYGMTLSLNEIFIYMPGGVLKWKITPEQYVELSKIKNNEMIFPEGLTILAPTRPSSPTEFLIAYPGTFLNRNMRTFSLSAATLSTTANPCALQAGDRPRT